MLKKLIVITVTAIISIGLYADDDPYLWLEDVEGKDALAWVNQQNAITDESLAADPLYQELYKQALDVLTRNDKLPTITVKGEWVYNLWSSDSNPRGIYRRTKMTDFSVGKPNWKTVIDIDTLSKDEDTKWVFKNMTCLAPAHKKCLLSLAPGGSDATIIREFDPDTGTFVKGGFEIPLAKSRVTWLSEDELFIGTDFGADTLTSSGYPRIQKIWQRGTPLIEAKTVLAVKPDSVSTSALNYRSNDKQISVLLDSFSFWKRQYYQWVDGARIELKLPEDAQLMGFYENHFVISLKSDWQYGESSFGAGSVLLATPDTLQSGKGDIQLLAAQSNEFIVEQIRVTSQGIAIVAMEDVKSSLYFFRAKESGWQRDKVALPTQGQISITGSNSALMMVRYEDFLTPPTLYSVDYKLQPKRVLQQSATFDSSEMEVTQYFTKSADGTRVPYFVIKNKDLKMDGSNPTHIFSYGGFRNALQPSYSGSYEALNGAYGKLWLERGGVYVLANIRGGGEYGPQWHAAALRDNRERSFEDFEAIAEDLIARKITSAKRLSIEGRSNGGLLVGALMTRRPDLYGAVICGVPLLDMKRFNKLLAGASWMGEFGNPDTDDWAFISKYSPYQNMQDDVDYPATFFFTSTKDDRVHPGHARKMAAKMKSMKQTVEYYENLEGGHLGSSTAEQLAKRVALSFTHLWRHSGS